MVSTSRSHPVRLTGASRQLTFAATSALFACPATKPRALLSLQPSRRFRLASARDLREHGIMLL
ncbi:hypothetical protein BAUCODRAFT_342093 [Baudoinia panamericana UAMH 10762]|uniref:Uncharacterized protein n=1 Tax=Baudoinia panamericana (strain UAMH 10762) TaxID=717646 RepID=M2NKD8_BAUPA|nr:uncharacterized protein BAUCODRAFT_342093 [Baudoinia panamericana UAMH 10762]EMC99580.1 hypothetical protein BAUCODRAFT_342093 [Baudoinia panamericana UAMH 10762]